MKSNRRGNKMKKLLAGLAIASAAVSFVGLSTASTALADPPSMAGTYVFEQKNPEWKGTWVFTQKDPTTAEMTATGGKETGEAKFANGQWKMSTNNGAQQICSTDNKPYDATYTYEWDPNTLSGTYLRSWKADTPCGKAGTSGNPVDFTLTKMS
jgi:hypothetical protein